MENFYSKTKADTINKVYATTFIKYFLQLICVTLCSFATILVNGQGITINPRSSLVMNGNVSMVINNAALKNNGSFTASTSTVKFTGNTDTTNAHVDGNNLTTFYNLSVIKSGYGVALKSTVWVKNVLNVSGGNLYTDSNLTLKSDAALTARVDVVPNSSKIIGKAHVERYMPSKRAWRLLTAPVTSSNTIFKTWQNSGVYTVGKGTLVTGPNASGAAGNGIDASSYNNISMMTFTTATQSFANVTNTHVAISKGNTGKADNTGYFIFVRGDRNPNNTNVTITNTTTLNSTGILQTGTQTFTASAIANGYTLIGNPYASPIDFDKVSRTNLVKRFYVWDPTLNSLGGYVMMDDLNNDGIYVKSVLASNQTKDLQSGQAFFVETKEAGAASIVFNESSKSGNNNNMVFKPQSPNGITGQGAGSIRTTLNLLEANGSTVLADGVIAEFDDMYTKGVDRDDALKFSNINENLAILRSALSLAAERRPALGFDDTLYFKMTKMVQRNYQFEFTAEGLQQPDIMGLLIDSYLNSSTIINLSGITKVNFTVTGNAASSAANRFKIVFKSITPLPVTLTGVVAYQKNSNISVDWKVENEINIIKYDVEKSSDASVFTKVETIFVRGTNNANNSYSWLDVNALQGNNFYRIKIYDRSGEIKYSAIVKVATDKSSDGFSIYPNPIKGNIINLIIKNQAAGIYHVRLSNTIGQVLYISSFKNNGGNMSQSFNTGAKLPAGIYNLEIIGQDNNHSTQKVIVE